VKQLYRPAIKHLAQVTQKKSDNTIVFGAIFAIMRLSNHGYLSSREKDVTLSLKNQDLVSKFAAKEHR